MKKILILLMIVGLTGCATSVSYMSYTAQRSPAKPKDYFISIYSTTQKVPASQPYRIIGKVEVHGEASDGVTPEMLVARAQAIARAKGADAIINANTVVNSYGGTYVVPGHFGYRHYHPTRYIPYEDSFLKFIGELIVYTPAVLTN